MWNDPLKSQVVQGLSTPIRGEILPAAARRVAVRQPDPDAGGASAAAADRHQTKGPQEDLGQDAEGELRHHPRRQEVRRRDGPGGRERQRHERRRGQRRQLGLAAPRRVPGQRGVPIRRLDGAQQFCTRRHASPVSRYCITVCCVVCASVQNRAMNNDTVANLPQTRACPSGSGRWRRSARGWTPSACTCTTPRSGGT